MFVFMCVIAGTRMLSLTLSQGTCCHRSLVASVHCDTVTLTRTRQIWVLTGDKKDTAINIGFSCRLLLPHYALIVVDADDWHQTQLQLKVSRTCMCVNVCIAHDSMALSSRTRWIATSMIRQSQTASSL